MLYQVNDGLRVLRADQLSKVAQFVKRRADRARKSDKYRHAACFKRLDVWLAILFHIHQDEVRRELQNLLDARIFRPADAGLVRHPIRRMDAVIRYADNALACAESKQRL